MSNRNVELADVRLQLREGFFHLDSPPAPTELPADELAGAYGVRGWDEPAQIRSEDGELVLDAPSLGTAGVSLEPDGRNRFAAHLPMQAGSQSLIFVKSKGQIWLRSPWFVARKIESQ